MIRKLIPAILAVLGLALGAGAGIYLRPAAGSDHAESSGADPALEDATGSAPDAHGQPTESHQAAAPEASHEASDATVDEHGENQPEYVKLNNQFVVPVVENGAVSAMVILSLSLEATAGSTEAIYAREPKLRDVFLQVLFDHANAGGFRGTFTDGANLVLLRRALLEVARRTMGDMVTDVLIVDIARQDA